MFRYCQTQLSLGLSVVVDCPFARVDLYDAAVSVAHKVKAVLRLVHLLQQAVGQQLLQYQGKA